MPGSAAQSLVRVGPEVPSAMIRSSLCSASVACLPELELPPCLELHLGLDCFCNYLVFARLEQYWTMSSIWKPSDDGYLFAVVDRSYISQLYFRTRIN